MAIEYTAANYHASPWELRHEIDAWIRQLAAEGWPGPRWYVQPEGIPAVTAITWDGESTTAAVFPINPPGDAEDLVPPIPPPLAALRWAMEHTECPVHPNDPYDA